MVGKKIFGCSLCKLHDKAGKAAFLFFLITFISCNSESPVILSIDPKIGRMGEVITLTGSNFGESQDESYVTIAGIAPTGSSYYLWQDDLIMVRVPELGESGLVYVHARGNRSNGVLFSNSASIPRPIEGDELGLGPRITAIDPQTGTPGTLITITGSNFGVSRENGAGVFFSWDYESPSFNPYMVMEPEYIEVSEAEQGYVSWSTREVRVRVPDGAASGNIEVRTPHGRSRPVPFEVDGKPGIKTFTDKRSYTVHCSVDIRILEATRPNSLYLWMPMPVISPSQRNVSLISRNIDPLIENFQGVSLFKLDNLTADSSQLVDLSFSVDVYAVQTEVYPQSVRRETTPLSAIFTQKSALIPSDDPQIISTVNSIIGREQNPYIRARLLYNWIIANIQIEQPRPFSSGSVTEALESKQADTLSAALLYTTMVRAAGVPSVPVAGVLIDRSGRTVRHYWTEFWLNNLGWLPADTAMGAQAAGESFLLKDDPENYYFGNIDSHRIAFSRGEIVLSQMESNGRLVFHNQSYSLQNIREEASGGLESYTSLWRDVIISGIYAQ